MKVFIISLVVILLFTYFIIFQQDYNMHQRYYQRLKFVAEEAAASAAQYYITHEYGEGRFVFNQTEGTKAIEHILKTNLKLDDSLIPNYNSYFTEQITYTTYFFDDSNTTYPEMFTFDDFTTIITEPTVVIVINAGKARYRTFPSPTIRAIAAHEWKGR